MKKTLLFKLFTISFLLLSSIGFVNGQALLVENFDYTTGALLTANGWTAHSGAGTQAIDVTTGLTFSGYAGSDIGGAANLDNNGEDVNKTFAEQTTGTVYAALVIKTEATNGAGYFLNLGQTTIGTTFFSKVWVNATGDGVNVGTAAPTSYVAITPGTPTLIVLKLEIATKTTSFYVFNTFPTTEPVIADGTATETASFTNVGTIALRQFVAAEKVIVDGIRVATSWAEAVKPAAAITPTITVNSPVTGYQWPQGTSHDISWTATGTNADVMIEYTANASDPTPTWTTINAGIAASAGVWSSWDIPVDLALSADSKIRITDIPQTATGLSGKFSIIAAPAPVATFNPLNLANGIAITSNITITFNVPIRNIDDSEITDANVASLLSLKNITDGLETPVPFTATIDAAKKVITINPDADLGNVQLYSVTIAPVESASNSAALAQASSFTTVASIVQVIKDITISEVAPYYAGDLVTINWVSENVTDVKIEVWIPSENTWNKLFSSTPSDGSVTIAIPIDAQYSPDYKLRITDVTNPLVTAEGSIFTIIAVVNDLVSLRAQPVNAIIKYTGIATVTYAQANRNQKYIQDATAAVLIDDPNPGFIGTYAEGEGITNIVGKIILYNALIEFTPLAATGEHATGSVIVPEVRTLASLSAADQCKLVTIEDFAFKTPTQWDPTGLFIKSKNYDIDGQDNTLMVYRTAFAGADYIGGQVPVGTMSSVCLVGQFNTQMQITARSWSDMTLPFVLPSLVITEIMYTSPDASAKQEWVEIYNNGTADVDMGGFYILDSDPLHKADPIVLPADALIAPGEYYTIETSDNGQPELFPFTPDAVSIKFNFGKADEVKLFHSNGQLIDSVSYNSVAPWPTSPNGGGSSLTLCDPNLDNSLASSWEASLDEFTTLQATTILATPGSGCVIHTAVAPKLQNEITVYPNPTSDILYISNPGNEQLEIIVLSSIGKSVKSMKSNNQGVTSVDLTKLAKGIYMVKMINKTSNTTQMQKVVVR